MWPTLALLLSLCLTLRAQVHEQQLPFGEGNGDRTLETGDDRSSSEIHLKQPISFFDKKYDAAFVSQNGIISFDTELPYYHNRNLTHFNYSLIAAFYADIDTTDHTDEANSYGKIYYREETTDDYLLDQVSTRIRQHFMDARQFEAKSLLVATWDNVGYYNGRGDKRNSFQIVIASDQESSYATFIYGQIEWIRSDGKFPAHPDLPAQAGFISKDGLHETLLASATMDMVKINTLSNIDYPGIFVYRISGTGPMDPRAFADGGEYSEGGDDYYEIDYDLEHNQVEAKGPPGEEIYEPIDEYYYNPCPDEPVDGRCDTGCHIQRDDNDCLECVCDHTTPAYDNQEYGYEATEDHDAHGSPKIERTVEEARPYVDDQLLARDPGQTCAHADTSACDVDATCIDYASGFCCQCKPGYYGNGNECLVEGEPQRMNGRFSADVNGYQLSETDLHTYVVTSDGRSYTALSQIPAELGAPLLFLNTVGGVMGWLFAKVNTGNAYNGFQLTGGLFNRTVTVHIADSYTATVTQQFSGKDIFHYFKAKVFVTGSLPQIHLGSDGQIEYPEFSEVYERVAPGLVKSYSSRSLTINGQHYPMTIDQQIHYTECPHQTFDRDSSITLRVERSYVLYDSQERIVRYASANTIEGSGQGTGGIVNPCAAAHDCTGPNMRCHPDEQSYRCVCSQGYEMHYTNDLQTTGLCVDYDECGHARHNCHQYADCFNTEGSFMCQCRTGYMGNGYHCEEDRPDFTCSGYTCHANAECLPGHGGSMECVCMAGFHGNGVECHQLPAPTEGPVGAICRSHDECGEHGACVYSNAAQNYECDCELPYTRVDDVCVMGEGEGTEMPLPTPAPTDPQVVPEGPMCRSHEECGENGRCVYSNSAGYYQCECEPPYTRSGDLCIMPQEGTCDQLRNCDANADCLWQHNEMGGSYVCRCKEGYSGDGYLCSPTQAPSVHDCATLPNCHPDAQCIYDHGLQRHVCQCLLGFTGDGYTCSPDRPEPPHGHACRQQSDCHENGHCVLRDQYNDYVCECLPGFRGDGVTNCEGADQCNPAASDCGTHAQCNYSDREGAYTCQCVEGFAGDPFRGCTPTAAKVSCYEDTRICHPNAQCVLNHDLNEYQCICKPGASGDGINRCEVQPTPQCTGCSQHAECVQAGEEWECQCMAGYQGNGQVCNPMQTCLEDRSLCDEQADCVPGEGGYYVCTCRRGFHGNGQDCRPDSELRGNALLIGQGMSVVQRGLSADVSGKQLIIVPHQIVVGLDFDCQNEKIYWTDVSGHAIRSSNLDGSNVTVILEENLSSPEGIAVDWSSGNIYYTDSMADHIGVVNMDGTYQHVLLSDGLVNPRALAIDLANRWLYYTDWDREAPLIGRVSLDGTQRESFVSDNLHLPNGLTVLERRQELCWVDAGQQRLSCVGLDGRGSRVVYAPLEYPFGLTHHNEETFYWTDWKDNNVHSVSIFGENHRAFAASLGGSGKVYGILSVPEHCPSGETACAKENGGCPYLCLPTASAQKCTCPDESEGLEGCDDSL